MDPDDHLFRPGKGALAVNRTGTFRVLLRNMLAPLFREAEFVPNVMNPLAALVGLGAIPGLIAHRLRWLLLFAFSVATWLELSLSGQYYPHYYQLWLIPLCVGGGWAISDARELLQRWRVGWLAFVAGIIVFGVLLSSQIRWYRMDYEHRWPGLATEDMLATQPLAEEINQLLKPDEALYEWGSNSAFYIYTNRQAPTGILWAKLLYGGSLADSLSQRAISDLEKIKPEIAIVAKASLPDHENNAVLRWIYQNYEVLPADADRGPFVVYMRRGGALEQRIRNKTIGN